MTRSRLVLRTGLTAAFIVAAAFIPVHNVRAAGFDDFTSPRNAEVDAGGAEINGVKGNATVEGGSGSLTIENVECTLHVSDGFGNIDVERIAGDFLVDHKGSRSIRSSEVKGKVDIPDRHRSRGY